MLKKYAFFVIFEPFQSMLKVHQIVVDKVRVYMINMIMAEN